MKISFKSLQVFLKLVIYYNEYQLFHIPFTLPYNNTYMEQISSQLQMLFFLNMLKKKHLCAFLDGVCSKIF